MDQQNRPKTRGLEASEAEEDAKFVRAALKEPSKFMKRAVQKLKQDYGRGEDSDEEAKLFYSQPPYDDEETEVKPGTKRKRGGGRRNTRRKFKPVQQDAVGEGEEIKKHVVSARLAALLKVSKFGLLLDGKGMLETNVIFIFCFRRNWRPELFHTTDPRLSTNKSGSKLAMSFPHRKKRRSTTPRFSHSTRTSIASGTYLFSG